MLILMDKKNIHIRHNFMLNKPVVPELLWVDHRQSLSLTMDDLIYSPLVTLYLYLYLLGLLGNI